MKENILFQVQNSLRLDACVWKQQLQNTFFPSVLLSCDTHNKCLFLSEFGKTEGARGLEMEHLFYEA